MSTKFFGVSDIQKAIVPCPLILSAETSVIAAVKLMFQVCDAYNLNSSLVNSREKPTCVLVVENQKLVGIFTHKDLIKCIAMGVNLEQATLTEVMNQHPVTLEKSQFTNIFIALNLLHQYKTDNLAIVDEQNEVVGLVTVSSCESVYENSQSFIESIDSEELPLVVPAIKKTLERERELSELKSRFIAMSSHEFRTPLSVIASSAGILKDFGDQLDDERKKKHLDFILNYVKYTTEILDNILLINQGENSHLEFKPAPLDLISFCQQLGEEIQLSAPHHNIVFATTAQSGIIGNLDKKLLRRILINLLANAIKYSPDRTTVEFNLKISKSNVSFTVQDQGIGIPEADQVKLFESFHRGTNVGNLHGMGLGLSIVSQCIQLHTGSIAVKSGVGMGTTFIVTIPLR
jgi:signal transduction histidine kinase